MPKDKAPQPRILYTKIKISKGRVRLEYIEKIDKYFNEHSHNFSQAPKESFIEAIKSLSEDVLEICEINNKKEKLFERVEVHTISISYETEKEIPGVIISFKVSFKKRKGSININTPYLLLESREENSGEEIMNEETAEKIYLLLEEADKYKNGERQNYEFNFSPDPPETENKKEEKPKKELSDSSIGAEGKIFKPGEDDFIVKLDEEMKGAIKPGNIQQLLHLVNTKGLLSTNGKKGIYHLNPGENIKAKDSDGKPKNGFSFRRNGNVLILDHFLDEPINQIDPRDLNNFISEIIKKQFHEGLKITLGD